MLTYDQEVVDRILNEVGRINEGVESLKFNEED